MPSVRPLIDQRVCPTPLTTPPPAPPNQVLDLASNPLRRLATLDLLTTAPKLHTLTLRGTPLRAAVVRAGEQDGAGDPSLVGTGEACYRALVAAVLPRLLLLDGRRLLTVGGTAAAAAEVRVCVLTVAT